MKKYVFPYGLRWGENGKIVSFPSISVYFYSKNQRKLSALLLIDSGAEFTLLNKKDGEFLGINLEKGKEKIVRGVTGDTFRTFKHEILIEIGEEKFKIPILFSTIDESPRVLGREGIFEKFFILFNEKSKQTIFIIRDTDSEKKLKSIL
ncbi:MAG: hypothetical protein COX89_01010 [Candidatus Nealsonbacteria bacterium CG_4_10_14_0_2_um_filter_37_10]|uniref:Peptidase A2 domain-containing protein n=2 Tax=Candidatus Nealsoniibacteriota TaxID=1817911 RepID=A0A2M7V004_9BACT|nr:MAG: hypothetical protein COX89_01010 [Candidatus Nealsonbacteria bacterium CG_4_10_14_0_2_um_filter_37_10]PJA83954.1 MAG: hypothetical protein CO145_03135 [Candidatus Nealsonbacteria bacterium CG_4_9_14_3_um_filter_37_13]